MRVMKSASSTTKMRVLNDFWGLYLLPIHSSLFFSVNLSFILIIYHYSISIAQSILSLHFMKAPTRGFMNKIFISFKV